MSSLPPASAKGKAPAANDGAAGPQLAQPTVTPPHIFLLQQQQCQAVYANLDSGRVTSALRECQRILGLPSDANGAKAADPHDAAKRKNPLAAALYALALMRTKRRAEALAHALEQAESGYGTGDHDVLLPLTAVLDKLGRADVSADLLEAAAKLHIDQDEHLAQKAFEALVVVQQWQRAQLLATKMYKAYSKVGGGRAPLKGKSAADMAKRIKSDPSGHYFWWSIVCYHLMARNAPPESAALSLQLAERTVLKHLSLEAFFASIPEEDNGNPNKESFAYFTGATAEVEQFQLLLSTLTKQRKWRAAFALLQTDAGRAHSGLPAVSEPGSTAQQNDQQGATSGLVGNPDIREVRWTVLRELGLWCTVRDEARFRVKEQGDRDWTTMLHLIEASIKLHEQAGPDSTQNHIDETRVFLEQLLPAGTAQPSATEGGAAEGAEPSSSTAPAASAPSGSKNKKKRQAQNKKKAAAMKERALFLARIELLRQARQQGAESGRLDTHPPFAALLRDYFERFSIKRCAYEDLQPHFVALNDAERADVCSAKSWLRSAAEAAPTDRPFAEEKDLVAHINAQKLLRLIEDYPSSDASSADRKRKADEEVAAAERYFASYLRGLPSGKDLPKTEMQPADDLAFLCAEALVSAWSLTKRDEPPAAFGGWRYGLLFAAAVVLTYALQHSPKGYILRILLIRICVGMSAFPLAVKHFDELGIRSVQQDSMTHWLFTRCSTFTRAPALLELIEKHSSVYAENAEETPRMIFRAFHFHNYSRAEELLEFHGCLENSLMRQQFQLERALCKLFSDDVAGAKEIAVSIPESCRPQNGDEQAQAELHDQRDFGILPSYMPASAAPLADLIGTGPRMTTASISALAASIAHCTASQCAGLTEAEQLFVNRQSQDPSAWQRALESAASPFETLHTTSYARKASIDISGEAGNMAHKDGGEGEHSLPPWLASVTGNDRACIEVLEQLQKGRSPAVVP